MKAFRFSLEAVHTLRQRQEQRSMEHYVRAMLARQQALEQLEAIRERVREVQQDLSRLLSAGCTAAAAAQTQLFGRTLEKQQADRASAAALAERRLAAAFQAMVAARQRRSMVEKFRDKQLARHRQAEAREEQKMLDDLASRRDRPLLAWSPTRTAP